MRGAIEGGALVVKQNGAYAATIVYDDLRTLHCRYVGTRRLYTFFAILFFDRRLKLDTKRRLLIRAKNLTKRSTFFFQLLYSRHKTRRLNFQRSGGIPCLTPDSWRP